MNPYIFIHINKTGGTSLWEILGETPKHKSAAGYISELGREAFDERVSFSLVRNPFDRAVSLYEYRKALNSQNIAKDGVSFVEFLRLALVKKTQPYFNRALMLSPQTDWLIDKWGNVAVHHILRFEDFPKAVKEMCSLVGIEEPEEIPHKKQVEHEPWPTYYTGEDGSEARNIILTEWAAGFEYPLDYSTEVPTK